jgi:hypothetical protein
MNWANMVSVIAWIATLLFASPALAAHVTATDVARGWYDEHGDAGAGGSNYLAGECTEDRCAGVHSEFRNFFVFELPLNRVITDASLRLWMPSDGFASPTGTEIYQLFAVHRIRTSSGTAAGHRSSTILARVRPMEVTRRQLPISTP